MNRKHSRNLILKWILLCFFLIQCYIFTKWSSINSNSALGWINELEYTLPKTNPFFQSQWQSGSQAQFHQIPIVTSIAKTNFRSLTHWNNNPLIYKEHPFLQLEYYKAFYASPTFKSQHKEQKNAIFNPYPAIPKQSSRVQYVTPKKPLKKQPLLNCKFKGKVFDIGMFKTATKNGVLRLTSALQQLGYHCPFLMRFERVSIDTSNMSGNDTINGGINIQGTDSTERDGESRLSQHGGGSVCRYWDVYHWYKDSSLLYHTACDDISWMFYDKNIEIIKHLRAIADISDQFFDQPSLFAYHLFDQYYSRTTNHDDDDDDNDVGAKFILTIRNSSWTVVNSNFKIAYSLLHHQKNTARRKKGKDELQIRTVPFTRDELFTMKQPLRRGLMLYDSMMDTARRYEVHNEKVIKYFTSKYGDRVNEHLLIVDLSEDGATQKIFDFLDCDHGDRDNACKNNSFDKNSKNFDYDYLLAPRNGDFRTNDLQSQPMDMIPTDIVFDWKNYNFTDQSLLKMYNISQHYYDEPYSMEYTYYESFNDPNYINLFGNIYKLLQN